MLTCRGMVDVAMKNPALGSRDYATDSFTPMTEAVSSYPEIQQAVSVNCR